MNRAQKAAVLRASLASVSLAALPIQVGLLTLISVFSLAAQSQPVQPQAQPPIVVQVQMPPTNARLHFLELIVPGSFGAIVALVGVWLTNKHNATMNAANRRHQLDVEEQRAGFEFRKSVYSDLVITTSELISNLAEIKHRWLAHADTAMLEEQRTELTRKLMDLARIAPLAGADDVWDLVEGAKVRISGADIDFASPNWQQQIIAVIDALQKLLQSLVDAGRKDLWIVSHGK